MIANMKANHKDVLDSMASEIPTFFMRFEDLIDDPVPVLTNLFRFLLDVEQLDNTVCLRRIKEVTEKGFADKKAYKLKSTSASLCRNRNMYSEAQINLMRNELKEMISFWGYNQG